MTKNYNFILKPAMAFMLISAMAFSCNFKQEETEKEKPKVQDDMETVFNYEDPMSSKEQSDLYVGYSVVEYLAKTLYHPESIRQLEIEYIPITCGIDFLMYQAKRDLLDNKVMPTDSIAKDAFIKRMIKKRKNAGISENDFKGYYITVSYRAKNGAGYYKDNSISDLIVFPLHAINIVREATSMYDMYGEKYGFNSEIDIITGFPSEIEIAPWCTGLYSKCNVPDKWAWMHELI